LKRLASIIIIAALLSGLCLAQSDGNATQPSSADQPLNLQGIWSFDLNGLDQKVTVVLHQSSNQLYGSASSEGLEKWNAVVMGSISDGQIGLTMISARKNSLVSTKLMGPAVKGSLSGIYLQADDLGGSESNLFTATLINPDTSSYAPAKVEADARTSAQPSDAAAAASSPDAAPAHPPITSAIAPANPSDTTKPVQLGNTYRDVHSLAGTVPESLGVGFIGDGTMGAGGSSMS
jgi:hypothetical protein